MVRGHLGREGPMWGGEPVDAWLALHRKVSGMSRRACAQCISYRAVSRSWMAPSSFSRACVGFLFLEAAELVLDG